MPLPLRVLLITYYWPPSGGAGVQRSLKFVKYLPQFGIEPVVLTVDAAQASYPVTDLSLEREVSAAVQVVRTPTLEPFELYKRLLGKKDIPFGGFANTRRESFSQKALKWLRGNLFIPDARVGWNRYALREARRLIKEHRIQAVITSSPPHSTQLIGLKLKRQFGLPWIADLRDPWTDIYYYDELLHTGLTKKLDARYERQVLEEADALVTVSQDLKRLFEQKSPLVKPAKIHVLPNGFDEDDFRLPSAPPTDVFRITYTGTLSERYDLRPFLQTLARLRPQYPELRLRFVGQVAPGIRQQLQEHQLLDATELLPFVPHEESVRYLRQSSVLLLGIPNVENNRGILTGKLFEYLAAGKPIIGIGPVGGDADAIMKECQAGRLFDYQDQAGQQIFLEELLKQWRQNPQLDLPQLRAQAYSRQALTGRLAVVLRQLVHPA